MTLVLFIYFYISCLFVSYNLYSLSESFLIFAPYVLYPFIEIVLYGRSSTDCLFALLLFISFSKCCESLLIGLDFFTVFSVRFLVAFWMVYIYWVKSFCDVSWRLLIYDVLVLVGMACDILKILSFFSSNGFC